MSLKATSGFYCLLELPFNPVSLTSPKGSTATGCFPCCRPDVASLHAGVGRTRTQRELFLETLICNVDPNAKLLMADMVPTGLAFHSSHHGPNVGSSRHLGYVVHGQHEVKVAHKSDALDAELDIAPLTQERKP